MSFNDLLRFGLFDGSLNCLLGFSLFIAGGGGFLSRSLLGFFFFFILLELVTLLELFGVLLYIFVGGGIAPTARLRRRL